ncbi:MAG: S8 family serine peptidase, partial [Anaerolineae bacterium]
MARTRKTMLLLVVVLMLGPWPPLLANEPAGTVYVRISAADYGTADVHPVQATDYGAFVWLELTEADLAVLEAQGVPFQATSEPFTLHLGGLDFDPLVTVPQLADDWNQISSDGPDLHLVQFSGPIRSRWLDELRAGGLTVVQYIHPFTYVVWGQPVALSRAAGAAAVRWTGPFQPAYRVLPRWRALADDPTMVDVLLVRAVDTRAVVRRIEALGGQHTGGGILDERFEIAGFEISGAQLPAVARIPGVYSVQPQPTGGGLRGEMSNQINVNNHNTGNIAFPGYQDWLAGAGVDGSGVIMANVDAGIEHTHPDLANRMVPCSGTTCGGDAEDGHGTHTAGIMAADGSSGVDDAYGFLRGQGMAPGANLVEQVYSPYYTEPDGMLKLMTDSYNNGASLSGNSWGPSGTPQGYDLDTMQVDIGVRDADPESPGNQPLSYILSIMNGNGGEQTQGTPDEAKNILSVGSTRMQYGNGAQDPNIDDLSFNTAHGPALDGRTIPHMVAPGCTVDSTSVNSAGDPNYALMCGTSMASPHVSGAVALFIQYYRDAYGADPSPALIKAAFLPVAHDLAGHRDADYAVLGHPFDSKQGWGRLDAAAVLSTTVAVQYHDDPLLLGETGDEWVWRMQAGDPEQPVRVMLAWTDAPGHGLGGETPAWNNDLDLVVEAEGATYRGNAFGPDGWSQAGGTADSMNNTEGVFLAPATAERFVVRVQANNINSDGVPHRGDDTDQDFALVCYNCASQPDFTLAAFPYKLEACAPAVVSPTIQVGEVLTYEHDVTLELGSLPLGITDAISPTVVTPPGEAQLSLALGPEVTSGVYSLVISGTAQVTNVHTTQLGLSVYQPPDAVWQSDAPVRLGQAMRFTATVSGTAPL